MNLSFQSTVEIFYLEFKYFELTDSLSEVYICNKLHKKGIYKYTILLKKVIAILRFSCTALVIDSFYVKQNRFINECVRMNFLQFAERRKDVKT